MLRKLGRVLMGAAALSLVLGISVPNIANAREIIVRHDWPHQYRHVEILRHRYFRGAPIVRLYGPLYPGFGFLYTDSAAWAFLGFTAWELALYNSLDEHQLRAHEAAIMDASTAPINETITWNDGNASGSVTPVRDGHTADGRECREFEQSIKIGDKSEKAHGTACLQPDGSWKMVNTALQ